MSIYYMQSFYRWLSTQVNKKPWHINLNMRIRLFSAIIWWFHVLDNLRLIWVLDYIVLQPRTSLILQCEWLVCIWYLDIIWVHHIFLSQHPGVCKFGCINILILRLSWDLSCLTNSNIEQEVTTKTPPELIVTLTRVYMHFILVLCVSSQNDRFRIGRKLTVNKH